MSASPPQGQPAGGPPPAFQAPPHAIAADGGGAGGAWLMHVPIPLFAVVMGLTGLGLAWRKAGHVAGAPEVIGESVIALAATMFVLIALLYAAKALRHWKVVVSEFNHPIRANFFPAVSISLLLLAVASLPYSKPLASALCLTGGFLHLVLALNLMGRWLLRNVEIQHSNPAWFIPIVGNILVPVSAVKLGHTEMAWFFFAVGLTMWIIVKAIIIYRIIFHDPLPSKLMPTLFILIAPPAVGFLAYMQLSGGELDAFARVLFHFGLFMTLLNLWLARAFFRIPFAVSWWAFTFPTAAITIAAFEYAHAGVWSWGLPVAWSLLGLASVIISAVFLRTLWALFTGHLFVPE
ncbi:SLAC1 anion channel family protein [Roseospirillum parvum]|uniref:Tellurite resistance protein n=1 Tax=Roseospirillum parvum TaxID=83401 RepID=A0A1G8E7G1_9PROT|nr:SLAC1 anion channel family protein [Roseospirillum parvum]SDH65821.1 tellurite resistance protein [Roseospirillum parvum]